MDFLDKIQKHNYSKHLYTNGACSFQDVKSIFRGKEMFVGRYLHTIYPGINEDNVKALLDEAKIIIHNSYVDFLKQCNGFSLFSNSFAMCGFGRILINGNYLLTRDPSNPIPVHLVDENNGKIVFEKMKIGVICDTYLFMDNSDGSISRVDKSGSFIESWDSIKDCIENLFDRLEKYYNDNGICKKPIIIDKVFINQVKSL